MAFVGLGWWSDMLAGAAQASGKIEIAAGLSRSPEKRSAFAAKFGGAAKESFEDVLDDPEIGAVVLTTPNSLHAVQCIEAARAGKHVFIEKPMALTVADCQRMLAETGKAGVILAIGQNKRRMPAFRKVAEMVANGDVGTVILIEANSSSAFGLSATPEQWRWFRSESPGGPLTSHTVHHADLFNHLLGTPARISAFTRKICGSMEADDVMTACLEFGSGALGYLGGSMMSPARKYFSLLGTEGLIFVDEDTGTLSYKRKGEASFQVIDATDPKIQTRISLEEELDEFAACIEQGKPPEVGGREGMEAVAVLEAIVRSADSGKAVEVGSLSTAG